MEKIIGIDDVIQVKMFPDRMIVNKGALKNKQHCNSIDQAQKILGDGVSLEIVFVGEFGEYSPIKVYLSKKSTCCLLAKAYPEYRI